MLHVAGELSHPVVQVVGHGDAGNDAGEYDSGGRSSGTHGHGVVATYKTGGGCYGHVRTR